MEVSGNFSQILGLENDFYHVRIEIDFEALVRHPNVQKGQIISKGLLLSSNSPKKQMTEFVFTTTTNSFFVRFLGESEDTKKFLSKLSDL